MQVLPAGYHKLSEMSTGPLTLLSPHILLDNMHKTLYTYSVEFQTHSVTIWHMTRKDYDAKLKQLQSEDSYFDSYKSDKRSKKKKNKHHTKKKDKWGDWN